VLSMFTITADANSRQNVFVSLLIRDLSKNFAIHSINPLPINESTILVEFDLAA
jgi:hypothetical protein